MKTKSREADRIIDIRDGHFDSERSLLSVKVIAGLALVGVLSYGAVEAKNALDDLNDKITGISETEEDPDLPN